MSASSTRASPPADRVSARSRPALIVAACAFLVLGAAGLLLWWRGGQDVFVAALTSAIAGCF